MIITKAELEKKYDPRSGVIYIPTDKKFVSLTFRANGIIFTALDEPDKKKISFKIEHKNNIIPLPHRISRAYELSEAKLFTTEVNDAFYLKCKRVQKIKQEDGISYIHFAKYLFQKKNIVFSKDKIIHGPRLSMDSKCAEGLDGDNLLFEYVSGKKNYIRISNDSTEKVPDITQMKEEFGPNLYLYPYEDMTYRGKFTTKGSAVDIPVICFRKWGLQSGDTVRMMKMNDGSIIIAPQTKKCFIDNVEIDPIVEPVKEITVCEPCCTPAQESPEGELTESELGIFKELILAFKDMQKTLEEVKTLQLAKA